MNTMKLIGAIMLLAGGAAYGQNAPQNVTDAFKAKFPNATEIEWEKENENEWEAEFKLDGKEYSANFSSEGNWLETEHEIPSSELPAKVKKTIETDFAGYEIEEAEIVEKVDGTYYEVDIEKGEVEIEVLLDSSGKVIKKEIEDEEENEEDED